MIYGVEKMGKFDDFFRFMKSSDGAPYVGQGLAQLPKAGISLVSTELGNKIWNFVIGLIGNIANEWKMPPGYWKYVLRSLFNNMMWSFGDPTANQLRALKRNVSDLWAGIRTHNFGAAFGALIEEPQEVVGAIRACKPNFRAFRGFKSFRTRPLLKKGVTEVSSDMITRYTTPITEEDIILV